MRPSQLTLVVGCEFPCFFFFSSLTLTNLWLGMRFGWNVITWGLAGQVNNQYVPELKLNANRKGEIMGPWFSSYSSIRRYSENEHNPSNQLVSF